DMQEPAFRRMLGMLSKPGSVHPQYVAARAELDEFVRVLEGEGVKVRRPDAIDATRGYSTPDWVCESGRGQTVPRDVIIVIGDEIIEAPMSWRSRYFESYAY